MLIFICFLFLLVLGIGGLLLYMLSTFDHNWVLCSSATVIAAGAIGLLVIIAYCIIQPFEWQGQLYEYEQDRAFIERCYDNNNLSALEIDRVTKIIISDNKTILTNKLYDKNPWVNWFYSKRIGELELFDMSRIKTSNQGITVY